MQQETPPDPIRMLHVATEETRWRILDALKTGPMTANEIAHAIDSTPQHANFHANKLVEIGLVQLERVTPERGGMKVKRFRRPDREFLITIDDKGAHIHG